MEELRGYLDQLFRGVPETPEMLRAKAELLQMMEDKYEELLGEGKRSDEAVKTVIEEFGSFEEIGEELGIDEALREKQEQQAAQEKGYPYGVGSAPHTEGATNTYSAPKVERPLLTMNIEQLRGYLKYTKSHAVKVALGVAFCILAPYCAAVMDDVLEVLFQNRAVGGAMSSLAFFGSIALAVAMFIMASGQTKRAASLKKKQVQLDEGAQNEMRMRSASFDTSHSACIAIGIGLCILGPAISSLSDMMPDILRAIFGPGVLLCAGIGVGLLVYAASTKNRLDELSKGMKRYAKEQGAAAEGAPVSEWTYQPKSMTPVWVIILIVIILAIGVGTVMIVVRGVGSIFRWPFFGMSRVEAFQGKEEFDSNAVSKIMTDLTAGDIEIKRGDTAKIVCDYQGSYLKRPKIELKNGVLEVKTDDGWTLSRAGETGRFTFYVPADRELTYELDMSAGDIRIEQITASKMSVDLSAGDVRINSSEVKDSLDLDMSAGDVQIDNTPVKKLSADLSAGDFRYHFADRAKADDYKFALDTSAGDVHFLGENYGDEMNRSSQNGSEEYKISVDSSLGDITID